jgi:hypothetical protein
MDHFINNLSYTFIKFRIGFIDPADLDNTHGAITAQTPLPAEIL